MTPTPRHVVRQATLADLEPLARLFQEEVAHQRALSGSVNAVSASDSLRRLRARLRRGNDPLLIAEHDGHVIGYIDVRLARSPRLRSIRRWWKRLLWRTPPDVITRPAAAWIEDCYVAPSARRRGVGGALVEEAMKGLRDHAITDVQLTVFAANREGVAFWERHGFSASRVLMARRTD
jgi:ribosomal protein S18 acetylase RimI-like enzyme